MQISLKTQMTVFHTYMSHDFFIFQSQTEAVLMNLLTDSCLNNPFSPSHCCLVMSIMQRSKRAEFSHSLDICFLMDMKEVAF